MFLVHRLFSRLAIKPSNRARILLDFCRFFAFIRSLWTRELIESETQDIWHLIFERFDDHVTFDTDDAAASFATAAAQAVREKMTELLEIPLFLCGFILVLPIRANVSPLPETISGMVTPITQ